MSPGYLCVVLLGGVYQCEGGLGGKMVDARTHLLKSPVYQDFQRTRNYDRVRGVYIKVEKVHHQKNNLKKLCVVAHICNPHIWEAEAGGSL